MSRMNRGVGFCLQKECADYAKGVFLLNHGDTFFCPRCRIQGFVEPERHTSVIRGATYKEVRVEYNYDSVRNVYREIAIVRDEALPGRCSTLVMYSPLIRTEKKALMTAQSLLASLQKGDDQPLSTTEVILDMGRADYYDQLKDWGDSLAGSFSIASRMIPRHALAWPR